MKNPEAARRHFPRISPGNAVRAALVGSAMFGGGVAVDHYVLPDNHNQSTQRPSFSEAGAVLIPEIQAGKEVKPIPGSVIKREQSGFQDRHFVVIRTQEEMREALLRIRDPQTGLSIEYPFNPSTSVAVVAALGNGEKLENDGITGITVTENNGVLVARLVRTKTFTNHFPLKFFSTKDTSPVYLATFPRVGLKGKELPWQTTVNDEVVYIPGFIIGPDRAFIPVTTR